MPRFWRFTAQSGRLGRYRDVFLGRFLLGGGGNSPPSYEVVLRGWRPGLRKISLTNALVEYARLSVPEAKRLVDRLLAGEIVTVIVSGEYDPNHVLTNLRRFGAEIASEAAPEPTY